jgi:hypothetical protein
METIIPAESCTAGVEPGVDMSQVPLRGLVKWPSRSGARVPLTACGKFPRVVCCTPLIFVSDPIVAEWPFREDNAVTGARAQFV